MLRRVHQDTRDGLARFASLRRALLRGALTRRALLLAASLIGLISSCDTEEHSTGPDAAAASVATLEGDAPLVLMDLVSDSAKAAGASGAAAADATSGSPSLAIRGARLLSAALANVTTAVTSPAPLVTATSIPYAPEPGLAANFGPACDDCVMTDVPLGFSFGFFGNSYDKLDIVSNGFVRFGTPPNRTASGCCTGSPLPRFDGGSLENVIAVAWTDLWPTQPGMLRYETRGTAPNRRFLLQWVNVPDCCSVSSPMKVNAQLILYEGTNVIEIHTASMTQHSRVVTQGIENETGTVAAFIPGRAAAVFTLANDAVRYTTVPANRAPTALAGGNAGGPPADRYEGVEGSSIAFKGTGTDPDGDAVSYFWDFDGDGTIDAATAAASHVYADNGDFTARFTVNDGRGGSSTATVPVHVANASPVIAAGGDLTTAAGNEVKLDAAFSDPGADDRTWSYTVLWGDDAGGQSQSTGGLSAQGHITPSHTYAAPGRYVVTVKVKDKDGAEGLGTLVVTSTNSAPVAAAGEQYAGVEGQAVAFDGSASSDGDGDALAYSWDFGDHTAAGVGAKPTHVYADDGKYVATLTVTDGHGGTSTATVPVAIGNQKPTATFVPPAGALAEGTPFTLALTGASDVPADLGSLRYAFDCGTGYGPYVGGTTVSCTPGDDGSMTVRGKVEDDDGGVSEYTASVSVANVAPTGTFGAPASVTVGHPITLGIGGLADPGAADLATLRLSFDCGTGSGFAPGAVCPTSAAGTRTVYGRVSDKDGGATTYGPFTVTIDPATTSTVVAAASAQYSDPVSLSATLSSNAGPGAGSPTGTMEFFVNGASVGTATVLGTGLVTLAPLPGTRPAGSYAVTATYRAAGSNFRGSTAAGGPLTVARESARTDYTGDSFALTANPAAATAPVRLAAALTQDPDGHAGNAALARVRFELYRASNAGSTPDQAIDNVAVDASGNATSTLSLPIDSWTVKVVIPATNGYWAASPVGVGTLTVAASGAGQHVTGGGWIPDAASPTGKGSFSFTVNASKNGAPKGDAQYLVRGADGYDYAVRTTSWAGGGLTFFADPAKAFFTGRASVQKLDPATGRVVSTTNGLTLSVDLVDGDESSPRGADRMAVTILDPSGAVWRQVGSRSAPVTVGGGNVKVHGK